MIDGAEKLHGYQVYNFAARDYLNGIEKSTYGRVRHIKSSKTEVDLYIYTCRADLQTNEHIPAFKELTLIVSSQKDFTHTSQCSGR